MLSEAAYTTPSKIDLSSRVMYKSIASLGSADNLRLYKTLVEHFSSIYPALSRSGKAEFHLGGDQTFCIQRSTADLVFEVVYSDISRFASITRTLSTRARKHAPGFALSWNTSRVTSSRDLLELPRPLDEVRPPEDVLMSIFYLDQEPAEAERKITACIDALYPCTPRRPGEQQVNENHRTIAQLADWLAFQDARQTLEIVDPDHAATMLISMMFGGLASRVAALEGLPARPELIGYLKSCVQLFVRGCRREEHASNSQNS